MVKKKLSLAGEMKEMALVKSDVMKTYNSLLADIEKAALGGSFMITFRSDKGTVNYIAVLLQEQGFYVCQGGTDCDLNTMLEIYWY